jgi:uncharacterized protein YukE
MVEPMGFAHYRDNYDDAELWAMIHAGDPWSVEESAGVWRTARQGLESSREALKSELEALAEYWQGPASEEFQRRMMLVHDYAAGAEERMRVAEEVDLPDMAGALQEAQDRAQGRNALGENLSPNFDLPVADDWMHEVKRLPEGVIALLDPQARAWLVAEHAAWRQARHDELARTVADLGSTYAFIANERFADPPAPPPEDMPGNATYEPPVRGVFADSEADGTANTVVPGGDAPPVEDGERRGEEDEPASPWTPRSYTDIDGPAGGLASGTATVAGTVFPGGAGAPAGSAGGAGPFGPVRTVGPGAVPGRGAAASVPGRGAAASLPGHGSRGTGPVRGEGVGPRGRDLGRAGARGGGTPPGKRGADEAEEEVEGRSSKYVEAEDFFTAPFDPAAGPAKEGPKHQRAWDKEYAAWEERRREDDD